MCIRDRTYATQASLLDSMGEQTTPFPLALEVNEIPNLLPRSLVDEAKGAKCAICRVEFDVKKIKKNTKISWFILKMCA